jgi:hypothetical protein
VIAKRRIAKTLARVIRESFCGNRRSAARACEASFIRRKEPMADIQ